MFSLPYPWGTVAAASFRPKDAAVASVAASPAEVARKALRVIMSSILLPYKCSIMRQSAERRRKVPSERSWRFYGAPREVLRGDAFRGPAAAGHSGKGAGGGDPGLPNARSGEVPPCQCSRGPPLPAGGGHGGP